MRYDMIVVGVGGQGVLSISTVLAAGALEENLHIKQSEVHGMSQRGGAVLSHLRMSDRPIAGDTVSQGCADMILAMEPLEGLRYLRFLSPQGRLTVASSPVRNITDYPPLEETHREILRIPGASLVEAEGLAREQGSALAVNMVMVGAASPFLPIGEEKLRQAIQHFFQGKGPRIVEINLAAFQAGRRAAM